MRYLLLLAFWFIGENAHAQQFSAGLRASGNYFLQRTDRPVGKAGLKSMPGTKANVAPEAFLRYQGKKSWAAEFALTTDRMQQQYWWNGNSITALQPSLVRYNARSIEAAINLQYELRCQQMASVPALKNFHSYIGIGTSLSRVQQQGFIVGSEGDTRPHNTEYWYHWISLSKTIRYDVNKNFSLTTGGQCGMNSVTMFRGTNLAEPSIRFSLKLGAAYNW